MYTKILKNRIFLTITISIVISAFIFSPLGLLNGIYHYINENIKATLIKHEENSNNNIVSVVEIDDEAYEKL
ncbi:MAG: hypothetical protein LBF15_02465 [Candidatus Peribacteria bacterium]|nr:hypothetical protein [Candidatus Peribacteria bacterium]